LPIPALLASLLLAAPGAASSLEQFFTGTTHGSGSVSVIMSGRHSMRDRSRGRIDADGALRLDQIVEEEGKPARKRVWRLVRAGANRVSGTISDARGAVAGELTDNSLHLRYRMIEGPSVEQWIVLQPGGRTATNRMTFKRFGLTVASVKSEIRKID
jgi:hypothetical protein